VARPLASGVVGFAACGCMEPASATGRRHRRPDASTLLQMVSSILEALASLAWPAGTFLSIFWFRSELRSLLLRLQKISPTAAEFGERSQQLPNPRKDLDAIAREVSGVGQIEPVIRSAFDFVHKRLDEIEPVDRDKRELRLTVFSADLLVQKDFFMIYLNIFRSQIEALERASASGDEISLRPFYDVHVARYEAGRRGDGTEAVVFSFEQWRSFLFSNGFMAPEGDRTAITERGQHFLGFVRRERLPQIAIL
jgi:hypothetical protein